MPRTTLTHQTSAAPRGGRKKTSASIGAEPAELECLRAEIELLHALKLDALATLARGIAHDFNNVLTGIIGYQELAAEVVSPDDPGRAFLLEARDAGLRARAVVEQMVAFGRRRTAETHAPVDLATLVAETADALRAARPAGVAIETDCAAGCDAIPGDAAQLREALAQLAANALDAMPGGGVLRLALAADGAHARLTVSDTGRGMDEATRRRAFDPFFTTKPARSGAGLGLAVVQGIVRAHRGAITVESAPGRGAMFTILLPCGAGQQVVAAPARRGGSGLVCLVEDDEGVRRCTQLILEQAGWRVRPFAAAEPCLDEIGRDLARCDAAVIDQTIPGAPGADLAVKLRRLRPGLPIVIMSAFFTKLAPDALGAAGGFEALAKPFTPDELRRAIARARGDAA